MNGHSENTTTNTTNTTTTTTTTPNNNTNNNNNNLQADQQYKMVDTTPSSYPPHVTFEAVPPAGLLSRMGSFLNADVTNPRELYSILSESKHQGAEGTPVNGNPQQNVRLPPLQQSASEAQFRTLGEQPQHSSYPDLASLSRLDLGSHSQLDTVRRSTSLQDVSSLDKIDGLLTSKKLTPIQRPTDPKGSSDAQEKEEIHSGRTETQLGKDHPLPPIEGKGEWSDNKGAVTSHTDSERFRNMEDTNFHMDHNSPSNRRLLECPRFIFPHGRPVQVKKPLTPTYDDYPEAYWELRSPTLQEPSDLKEDMIDRDNYRLQQISMLHLRAMNRDRMTTKLDAYRKWQQNMQEHLPPLGQSHKLDLSRAAGASSNGPLTTERSWKQHKVSVPVQNQALVLAVTPFGNSVTKRLQVGMHSTKPETKEQVTVPTAAPEQQENGDEKEPQRPQKSKANGREKEAQKPKDVKPLKAAVVNLHMSPAPKATKMTSDPPPGLRNTQIERRVQSGKAAPQPQEQYHPLNQDIQNTQVQDPARETSTISNAGTMSSSLSHYLQRVPSAPAATPPPTLRTLPATTRDRTKPASESPWKRNARSKVILNKFNRLQVFGEKGQQVGGGSGAVTDTPCYVMDMRLHRKRPYLPQNRPPTYRLDMKNYPPYHHGPDGHEREMGLNLDSGGYPILVSERGGMPIVHQAEHVDPASLSFRFRDGEVIVSRQGRKTHMT